MRSDSPMTLHLQRAGRPIRDASAFMGTNRLILPWVWPSPRRVGQPTEDASFIDFNSAKSCAATTMRYTIQLYSTMADVTKPQRQLLRFLEERDESGEPPPTYREMCTRLGYKSPKAATDLVASLEKKGLVTVEKHCARGIRLVQKNIGIPVLGHIDRRQLELPANDN